MKPMPESDDLDALLARVDTEIWGRHEDHPLTRLLIDLAAALRECRADYLAALDVIGRLTEGWDARCADYQAWHRDDCEPYDEPMSDREWRIFCEAARRAHQSST